MASTTLARSLYNLPKGVLARHSRTLRTCAVLRDTPTHTGQEFSDDDYRNARFEVAPRQTNDRWAIDLIRDVPPKAVKGRVVACDGGPGALGHPRVYINLDAPGTRECIYCQLRFYKDESH
ncbi:hypothetical protein Pmani_027702 [Petrolisthes manimaculis]|uniref:Zinc finger CHCC-type domain-containing protein n=1 Tax=Petrolisthes manimaculis TaxID=1843537 RepID=A0AAE1P1J6_9EUCA|nr:hypothetical protein Pmani_027702 [Petrolisthes manimaculis]